MMSRTSVWLELDRALQVGVLVELDIAWPILLHNKTPLKLVIHGRTVSTESKHVEIKILRHEFRTRALSPRNYRASHIASTAERTMTASA